MYRLVRSRRKTLGIYVNREAEVEVRAPLNMSESYIDRFVRSRQAWIDKAVSDRSLVKTAREAFKLTYGDMVLYRGQPIQVVSGQTSRPFYDGAAFVLPEGLSDEEIKKASIDVYKAEARKYIAERLDYLAKKVSVTPAGMRISSARTRWGSCSANQNLNFSWRLIMASDEAIDYVIIHELAHLKELNHSQRFWALVQSAAPDHKSAKAHLRQLHKRLSTENWS